MNGFITQALTDQFGARLANCETEAGITPGNNIADDWGVRLAALEAYFGVTPPSAIIDEAGERLAAIEVEAFGSSPPAN